MVDPERGRDTPSTEQDRRPGEGATSISVGENGGPADCMEVDDIKGMHLHFYVGLFTPPCMKTFTIFSYSTSADAKIFFPTLS